MNAAKNLTVLILLAAVFASGAFAETKMFGGFSAGIFSESVKAEGKRSFETKVPFAVFCEADFFPKPDGWLGFSGKIGFSGNGMTSFGEKGDSGWHKDLDAEGRATSISLFASPGVEFRKTFENFQYLSGSVGPVYNFSYLKMPMKSKKDGKTARSNVRNIKNSLGLNFEGFYKLSKGVVDHGLFLNLQWLFASKDSELFGASFRLVNALDFSIGYKVGGSFSRKSEGMTGIQRQISEQKQRERLALQAKIEERRQSEKAAEHAVQKADDSFRRELLKVSRASSSPVVIAAKSCEKRADGGKNLMIEFQNVSDDGIAKVVFNVVARDKKGKPVDGKAAARKVVFDRPVEPNFSAYIIAKRNFWNDSRVEDFDIASMTVFYSNGKKKTVKNAERATVSEKIYQQRQEIEYK